MAGDAETYRRLVGDAWNERYEARFAELARGGPVVAFNPEAALTPLWGFKRKIPVLRGLVVAFPFLAMFSVAFLGFAWGAALPTLAYALLHGLLGDWFYFHALRAAVAKAEREPDPHKRNRLLERSAAEDGAGDLVARVLVVALGYFVVFATQPGTPHDHPKAYPATVKADLRNLVTAQESFFLDSSYYAMVLPRSLYWTSTSVTVQMLWADSAGFGAEGVYVGKGVRCEIFVGPRRGLRVAVEEAEPVCEVPEATRH